MGKSYMQQHITWLKQNANSYHSYAQLAEGFNKKFATTKSVNALQQFVTKKLGIYLCTPRKATHYTPEEEKWLKTNYDQYTTYETLVTAFNQRFCKNRTVSSIREKCTKQLGLTGMINPTVYKKGNVKKQCPIGTIRKTSNGSTYIKVRDSIHSYQSGYREPYWLPIQKKIWMDHYGKVPKGKMVIFLDGNKDNLNISNLYCIDRKISALLASNKWYSQNAELTMTAIKCCELLCVLNHTK